MNSLDLPQVDFTSFSVEYPSGGSELRDFRPRSEVYEVLGVNSWAPRSSYKVSPDWRPPFRFNKSSSGRHCPKSGKRGLDADSLFSAESSVLALLAAGCRFASCQESQNPENTCRCVINPATKNSYFRNPLTEQNNQSIPQSIRVFNCRLNKLPRKASQSF